MTIAAEPSNSPTSHQTQWRVATVSVTLPAPDEGATGPSHLGTGDDSARHSAGGPLSGLKVGAYALRVVPCSSRFHRDERAFASAGPNLR